MDEELISYFDARFSEISWQIETLREMAIQQIAALHSEIQLVVAAGRIDQKAKPQASPGEVNFWLEEIQALISPYYTHLDRRVRQLEERAAREGRDPIEIIRERFGKAK